MRKKQQKQMPLIEPASGHPQERELEIISQIIDRTPTICDYVLQDLNQGKVRNRNAGAQGMSADQLLRAAFVKQLYSISCVLRTRQLHFPERNQHLLRPE
jgi:hypothetical protein